MRFSAMLSVGLVALLGGCAMTRQEVVPLHQLPPVTTPAPVLASAEAEARTPVTILLSIDGFRYDYLDRGVSPNLAALAQAGVRAPMRPSFPSKTFPNHYTIVTGKRPDENGIVGNVMIDPRRPDDVFTLGDTRVALDPFWWDEAEPIWVTAEKQGVRTATMFWPGSEVLNHGERPEDWQRFDQNVTDRQRVNAVLDWVRRPADIRPAFITLYFDEVDTAGHHYGPEAQQTTDAIAKVDQAIGWLRDGLKAMGQPANIIVVSDHGMAETNSDRVIRIDQMLPRMSYKMVTGGTYAGIDPMPGKSAQVQKRLIGHHPHMDCWNKADIPARFHYGRNPRVPPIICLAEVGWRINDAPVPEKYRGVGGDHGYDNAAPEMRAVFVAAGPAIRPAGTLPVFDNVDIYPLLADLIGIKPLPSDGTEAPLAPIVRK